MRVLFDSSALFKRYAGGAGADDVARLHDQASMVVLAAHCQAELVSALTRQWRDGAFTEAEYRRVRGVMREDFEAYRIEALDRTVEDFALAAMLAAPLRATDALHIGTAQAARAALFVTADARQAAAAQALGLKTELVVAD